MNSTNMKPISVSDSNASSIQYQPLTSAYLDGACDVIKDSLFIPGALNAILGIPNDEEALAELEQLCRLTAKDGVSVVAVDTLTNTVVGAAFNKFWLKSEPVLESFAQTLKNEKTRQILDMIISTERMCNIFELLNVDCTMEIFLLGTSNSYKRQGIGRKLCEMSVDIAQNLFDGINVKRPINGQELTLQPVPEAVTAIFNSPISQKIGRHLGLHIAAERSNETIELMGKKYHLPEKTSTTLEYKKLTKTT